MKNIISETGESAGLGEDRNDHMVVHSSSSGIHRSCHSGFRIFSCGFLAFQKQEDGIVVSWIWLVLRSWLGLDSGDIDTDLQSAGHRQ